MTVDVPFSRPAHPAPVPGDAERAPRELMTLPGHSRDVRRWRLVEIRQGGRWRQGLLTVWRRPPGSTVWVVHVRWSADPDAWGWFLFDEHRIRPLPEPTGPAPAGAPHYGHWHDAVVVPRELTGPPTDPADECWRLAWLHTGGAWRSALVTARRRPGPDLPWIAHARWGEDKDTAWVIADGAALRPVPQPEQESTGVAPDQADAARGSEGAR
ncbi:hypothetical protein [Kitasatospora sp. NPDC054795]